MEFGEGHCEAQFGEEELELLNRLRLPLLEGVDPLLHELVLLSQVRLTVVILATEQVLLLGQGLILPGQPQQVDVKYGVLLGELDEPRLKALFGEVSPKLLNELLEFLDLHLLFVPVVGGVTDPLRHLLLGLGMCSLGLDIVLVELILSH